MAVDAVLMESPTMRATVADRVEALDRVAALELLPDGMHVTTAGVATYFGVEVKAVHSLVADHRAELVSNGYAVLTGAPLTAFKAVCGSQSRARSLALFTRRTVLNVAMLLRDSETARQVRCRLLDVEQESRRPAADPEVPTAGSPWPADGTLDAAVARVAERVVRDVVGTAVVPLLNVLAAEVGRLGVKVDVVADRVDRLERIVLDDDERALARRRRRLMAAIDDGADEEELEALLG